MKKLHDLKGMTVLSLQEGEQLGQVRDMIIDSKARQVVALTLNQRTSEGEPQIVATANISNIGDAAITVEDRSTVVPLSRIPRFKELARSKRSLPGMMVITETGTRLGRVGDLEVDPQTFRITALILKGFLGRGKLVPAEQIRTIGVDAVVVREEAALEGMPSWSAPIPTVAAPPAESVLDEEPVPVPFESTREEPEPAVPSVSIALEEGPLPPSEAPDTEAPPLEREVLSQDEITPPEKAPFLPETVSPEEEVPPQAEVAPSNEGDPSFLAEETTPIDVGELFEEGAAEEGAENPWQRWVRRLRGREED